MQSLIGRLLIVSMMLLPFHTLQAGMVGAEQVSAAASAQASRNALLGTLARADVASQLQAMGVDTSVAKARVGAMTDDEVHSLQGQIDALPAGAGNGGWMFAVVIAFVIAIWYITTQKK